MLREPSSSLRLGGRTPPARMRIRSVQRSRTTRRYSRKVTPHCLLVGDAATLLAERGQMVTLRFTTQVSRRTAVWPITRRTDSPRNRCTTAAASPSGPLMVVLGERIWRPRRRVRIAILAAVDATGWVVGLAATTWLRFSLDTTMAEPPTVAPRIPAAAATAVMAHLTLALVLQCTTWPPNLGQRGRRRRPRDDGRAGRRVPFVVPLSLPTLMVPRSVRRPRA